jgi:hypothetical protein
MPIDTPHAAGHTTLEPWAVLAAPLLLATVSLTIVIGSVFGWHPLWPTVPLNPSEAVYLRDRAALRLQAESGRDLSMTYDLSPEVAGGDAMRATPIEVAIEIREPALVAYLGSLGARVAPEHRHAVACRAVARELPGLVAHFGLDATTLDCPPAP